MNIPDRLPNPPMFEGSLCRWNIQMNSDFQHNRQEK